MTIEVGSACLLSKPISVVGRAMTPIKEVTRAKTEKKVVFILKDVADLKDIKVRREVSVILSSLWLQC